jgi:cytochrome c-type biogenesis protein CcmH
MHHLPQRKPDRIMPSNKDFLTPPRREYPKSPKQLAVLLLFLLALVLGFAFNGGASAQDANPDPPTDDEVNAIAKELYCPVCENTPLDVCPTQACEEWRQLIYDKLALGWDEEQIKFYFADQYGDRVLSAPPARGLNLLIYILPPLLFIGGVVILYKAFTSWRKSPPDGKSHEGKDLQEDEYVQRLEDELKDY